MRVDKPRYGEGLKIAKSVKKRLYI